MKPFFYVLDAASGVTEQVQTGAAETTGSTALKDQGENAPFAERAGYAGGVTLLGMVTIFIVLSILWGVVELLHRALHRGDKKPSCHLPDSWIPASDWKSAWKYWSHSRWQLC